MATKRKSSMSAVDSALAKQKADFDKAVAAGVELKFEEYMKAMDCTIEKMRSGKRAVVVLPKEVGRWVEKTIKEAEDACRYHPDMAMAAKKDDSSKRELDLSSSPNVGQSSSQFVVFSNELMVKISHLADTVDSVVGKIKPVLSPEVPTDGSLANAAPCQVGSEFVEFIEAACRRIDGIKDQLSEVIGRITL